MEDSEEGEWVMYSDYEKSRDGWQEYAKHNGDLYISEMKRNRKLESRMLALFYILMATYGVIVAKLIGWSLGL